MKWTAKWRREMDELMALPPTDQRVEAVLALYKLPPHQAPLARRVIVWALSASADEPSRAIAAELVADAKELADAIVAEAKQAADRILREAQAEARAAAHRAWSAEGASLGIPPFVTPDGPDAPALVLLWRATTAAQRAKAVREAMEGDGPPLCLSVWRLIEAER